MKELLCLDVLSKEKKKINVLGPARKNFKQDFIQSRKQTKQCA